MADLCNIPHNINSGRCSKCHNKIYMGATTLCGHITCRKCSDIIRNCPVCYCKTGKYEVYKDNELEVGITDFFAIPQPIKFNGKEITKVYFNYIPRVVLCNKKGETFLHTAAREGLITTIKAHIKAGIDINLQDHAQWTALHEAVVAGHVEAARTLLQHGALVNVPGTSYKTALHIAVEQKNIRMTKVLVEHGASLTACTLDGKTPVNLCRPSDLNLLDALSTNKLKRNLFKVFSLPRFSLAYIDVNSIDIEAISLPVHSYVHSVSSFLTSKYVPYIIFGNSKPNKLYLQIGILQGAFIFHIKGFIKFMNSNFQCPLNCLMELPKYAMYKSVMNVMNKRPPLFHSLHFYFSFTQTQDVDGYIYSSDNCKHLALMGGGKVLLRKPSIADETEERCFPYHAAKGTNLETATHYIIYDDKLGNSNDYSTRTIKVKPFSWFIECINTFSLNDIWDM